VVATDREGRIAFTSFALTVANVAPMASFNSQSSAEEESPFEISLSNADDPSPADKSAGFRYAFDCGDGKGFVDNGNVASRTCRAGSAGAQTVRGRISDKDGGSQDYSATVTVTPPPPRDLTPPDTNVTSGPEGTVKNAGATFDFASTEPGSTFECSLDGGSFERCGQPKRYEDLSEGPHIFQVRATDGMGNTDATPAQRAWAVDTAAPQTTVTAGPEEGSTSPSNTATFEFVSTEPNSDFECSLDGGAFADCASPWTYDQLVQGGHTFKVRALNEAGPDQTPASNSFTVDTAGPSITSVKPGGRTRDRTPTLGAVITDAQDELAAADIQLFVDGSEVTDFAYDQSEDRLGHTTGRLAYGGHNLKIVATDSGYNTTIHQHNFRVLRRR